MRPIKAHLSRISNDQKPPRYPEEFEARDQNKLAYRYPSGESYQDLVARCFDQQIRIFFQFLNLQTRACDDGAGTARKRVAGSAPGCFEVSLVRSCYWGTWLNFSRCIMGYFLDRYFATRDITQIIKISYDSGLSVVSRPLEDLPYIKVPLHTLIKLTPQAYGCEAEFIR